MRSVTAGLASYVRTPDSTTSASVAKDVMPQSYRDHRRQPVREDPQIGVLRRGTRCRARDHRHPPRTPRPGTPRPGTLMIIVHPTRGVDVDAKRYAGGLYLIGGPDLPQCGRSRRSGAPRAWPIRARSMLAGSAPSVISALAAHGLTWAIACNWLLVSIWIGRYTPPSIGRNSGVHRFASARPVEANTTLRRPGARDAEEPARA